MNETSSEAFHRVLILGGTAAGLQAAQELADAGFHVHLVEATAFLGCDHTTHLHHKILSPRWLEAYRHPLINIWTNAQAFLRAGEGGPFQIEISQAPRYVDISRCTACGDCISTCPVDVIKLTPEGALPRKAIYLDGQPGCAAIDKRGLAPCRANCPINQRAQGYIALIRQGRYLEAYRTIKNENPFPSVCGRVCNHRCEDACSRGKYDEPINIMALKRFVADWAYAHRREIEPGTGSPAADHNAPNGNRVAVIGAGPAGLTAALDLVRLGYAVTVFDALPKAGGMMRVGIPPHRLPAELLDWEVHQIVDEGVELCLSTWVDDIPALLDQGYQAVLIATGAHNARKLPIRNSNHPDNWLSLDVLRKARLRLESQASNETKPGGELTGKKVIVLGGGNVALDTARTVLRLGAEEVRMACLESRGEMPGFQWEVTVAEAEGIQMYPDRTFKEIVVQDDKIVGVRCAEIEFHGFKHGRPNFVEMPDSEHVLPADIVVWAIGQAPNFSFLPQDGSINTRYPVGVQADINMMTTMQGVFVAGDVRRGVTFFVVDAIAEGHVVARSIDNYLCGNQNRIKPNLPTAANLTYEEIEDKMDSGEVSPKPRISIHSIPLKSRNRNFLEVDLTLSEDEALAESRRCLSCGVCSECLACVQACKAGAVIHEQSETSFHIDFGAIINTYDPIRKLPVPPESSRIFHVPAEDTLLGSVASAHVMAKLGGKKKFQKQIQANLCEAEAGNRIGVFVCQCGGQISSVVDTQAVCERAAGWSDVVYSQELPFSCSPEAVTIIQDKVTYHELNKVVLAACACCPQEQVCASCTFQRVRCKDNLSNLTSVFKKTQNHYDLTPFEFVNIREQCAYPHANDPVEATSKATALIAAGVARARLNPLPFSGKGDEPQGSDDKDDQDYYSVLIVGNGGAANVCHNALQSMGAAVQPIRIIPQQIRCSKRKFMVISLDDNGDDNCCGLASAIILAPQDVSEANRISAAFTQHGSQPRFSPVRDNLETDHPGVFYCDYLIEPEIVGMAAAARAIAWLGRTADPSTIYTATVDPVLCRACSTCINICEFDAPQLVGEPPHVAVWIDPAICKGCGTCAAHCPSGAIQIAYSSAANLEAMLEAALERP